MLEVRNIAFSYGKRPVLSDVSFEASPGEVISVVGANGAGKTTLLKILATSAVPEAGTVTLDGCSAAAKPLKYRRQLGYLPERCALYEDMTVRDYLYYRARLKGELPKRVRRRVGEACEMCRIVPLRRKTIAALSAGQKKRVALADSLLLRPRLLLLDDLFAGLDYEMREQAPELISAAAAFSSVIITGHEFDDLVKCSNRFIVLRDGKVSSSIAVAGNDRSSLTSKITDALKGARS